MRALFAVLLLFAFLLVLQPIPVNAVSGCLPNTCSVTIERTISTNLWGVTVASDIVNLTTVPNAQISHLAVGIPANVSNSLRTATASAGGISLQVSRTRMTIPSGYPAAGQTYTSLDVTFPTAETGKFQFNLTTVYSGLLTYSAGGNGFTFATSPFPLVDGTYNATSALSMKIGDWQSVKIPFPANRTVTCSASNCTSSLSSINAFNATVWQVTFASSATQNVLTVSAGRLIQIFPTGTLQVTDSYNVTNLGPTLSSLAFKVPKGVSSITENYVLGLEIDQPETTPTPTVNSDGTSTVTFTPSFGSVPFNQSFRAKIFYTLSPSAYISTSSLGTFTVNFALFNNVQFYASSLQTRIVTPSGFRLNSVTGQTPQTSGSQMLFLTTNASPLSNLGFSLTYQLDPFWASLSPLSWAALVELALAGSVIAVWKGPGAGAALGVPVQLITKFVDLYDEKSSMRLESDKMEEDVARGALNRFDYKQRRRSLDRRLNEIEQALAPVKRDLSSVTPRFQDLVKRIERAEAELQVTRTTSADLKNQYRGGKMSRDLYESLSSDLARRKEKAQQSIDTAIINLREEIR